MISILPSFLKDFSSVIHEHQGKSILVGGAVRDAIIATSQGELNNFKCKDYDVEIFGISPEKLCEIIIKMTDTKPQLIGAQFGVYKLSFEGNDYDFSFPRREESTGKGHKDFDISIDSDMTFTQACQRRDLTIGAIGFDIYEYRYLDPVEGINDLRTGMIRAINLKNFGDDLLRVLRVAQMYARFGTDLIDQETFDLCKKLVSNYPGHFLCIPGERILLEMNKLLLSKKPSIGLNFLLDIGIMELIFYELELLKGCSHSPIYHAEGCVWTHTMMVIDEAASMRYIDYADNVMIGQDRDRSLEFMWACLCHDLGKPASAAIDPKRPGRVTSYNHENLGISPTILILSRLRTKNMLVDAVVKLVEFHLKPLQFWNRGDHDVSPAAFRRLALKVDLEMLVLVAEADHRGRIGIGGQNSASGLGWFKSMIKELVTDIPEVMKPIVTGKDLIKLGYNPGPDMGIRLNWLFKMQLDNRFTTVAQGIEFMAENMVIFNKITLKSEENKCIS